MIAADLVLRSVAPIALIVARGPSSPGLESVFDYMNVLSTHFGQTPLPPLAKLSKNSILKSQEIKDQEKHQGLCCIIFF